VNATPRLRNGSSRTPGVAGGTLAIIVGVLWYTSALWYYNGYQLPHI
jgi:hypothetical protein